MVMNTDVLTSRADALHASAKDGALKLPSGRYVFVFDRHAGVYDVTCDSDPEFSLRLNTRKITEARKLLREYTGESN